MSYNSFGSAYADDSALAAFLAVYFVFIAVVGIIGLASYVMNGVATLNFAKRTGVKNGWMGFIPYANYWITGRLSDVGSTRRHSGARLLTTAIVEYFSVMGLMVSVMVSVFTMVDTTTGDLTGVMPVGGIVACAFFGLLAVASSICMIVFDWMAIYRIVKNFGGASATAYFVGIVISCLIFGLVANILLLIVSTKEPMFKETEQTVPVNAPAPEAQTDSVFH